MGGPSAELRPLRRALAAEMQRLRGDVPPWASLPLALLPAVSLLLSLPADIRSAPPTAMRALTAALGESAFGGLLLIAAVVGALGIAVADRTGVLARGCLFGPIGYLLGARALSCAFSSAVFGLVSVAAAECAYFLVSGQVLLPMPVAGRTVIAVAGAGLWGYLLGVLVRSPVVVLFVVPATLSPGLLLGEALPRVAELLPLPALLATAGLTSEGIGGAGAVALSVGWVLVLGIVVMVVLRRRDRLGGG